MSIPPSIRVSLTQGLWPLTADNNITLGNGSTIVAPLGGYQVRAFASELSFSRQY